MNTRNFDIYRQLNMQLADQKDLAVLDAVVGLSLSKNFPMVDVDVAVLMAVLFRIRQFTQIIELGTGYGYSSLLLALCCPSASVITIESNIECANVAQKMFDQTSARERIRLVNTDISKIINNLPGKYDFVFIDAAKESYMNYFLGLRDHLSSDAVVVTDDIYFTGEINGVPTPGIINEKISALLADYRSFLRSQSDFITTFISVGCGVAISARRSILRSNG